MIHEDVPVIGRALTAHYMPSRPDVLKNIMDRGHAEGRSGNHNSWPIQALQKGDVYVADCFGKIAHFQKEAGGKFSSLNLGLPADIQSKAQQL